MSLPYTYATVTTKNKSVVVISNATKYNARNRQNPFGLRPGVKARFVGFVDANNNAKLDLGDKIFYIVTGCFQTPCAQTFDPRKKPVRTMFRNVVAADITKYGRQLTRLFRQARVHRKILEKNIKPQHKGLCSSSDYSSFSNWKSVRFNPPLSLNTTRSRFQYTRSQIKRFTTNQIVDPRKCDSASTSFFMKDQSIRRIVSMYTGDSGGYVIRSFPLSLGILRLLGIKPNPNYVDFAYTKGLTRFYHFDMN